MIKKLNHIYYRVILYYLQDYFMKEKIEELVKWNDFLDKHLNLKDLKKNFLNKIFEKVAYENLWRYKSSFKTDKEFLNYIQNISLFLSEIYTKKELLNEDILKLHFLANKDLKLKNWLLNNLIWAYRNKDVEILEKNRKWNPVKVWTPNASKIKKLMKKELEKLNDNLKSENVYKQVFWISEFVINSLIIHPFPDGNGKVFWILNDILLLKINFFPVFTNKVIKEKHTDIFIDYIENKNVSKTIQNYLDFIISVYKNYKF